MRILLADDHELVLDGFKAVIERHAPDAEVVTARSFDEAFGVFNFRVGTTNSRLGN